MKGEITNYNVQITNNESEITIKKVPLRRCVVCRTQGTKETFLRAVLTKDGKVTLDEGGKAQGRGAYVCKAGACADKAVKQRGFNRSFKRDAGTEVYEAVKEYKARSEK